MGIIIVPASPSTLIRETVNVMGGDRSQRTGPAWANLEKGLFYRGEGSPKRWATRETQGTASVTPTEAERQKRKNSRGRQTLGDAACLAPGPGRPFGDGGQAVEGPEDKSLLPTKGPLEIILLGFVLENSHKNFPFREDPSCERPGAVAQSCPNNQAREAAVLS